MRVKNRKMIGPNIARIQQANSEARMPEITKRTPVLCIYHDDLDGLAAAAVLQYFIGKDEEIVYHAMNHGDKYPAVECDQKVYILDFPLPEKFAECWGITHNIVWIDHHKSAIEEAQDIRVPGVREIGYPAASELTWEWFSGKECHLAIKMVSDRDSWNNKILNSGAFCLGMGLCLTKGYEGAPGPIWEEILSHSDSKSLNKIIENGKIIEKYLEEKNKEYCKTFSFRTIFRFDGSVYKCIVCNKGRTSSNLFDQTDTRE
jgi:oligoribonuclease NrnB/cAMP/cGMP phosphodiesterase (DHH superfamily)